MKLTCPNPNCRLVASIEAWFNEKDFIRFMTCYGTLPHDVMRLIFPYLAYFRPKSNRGLSWERAANLLEQLKAEIYSDSIWWGSSVARPNKPEFWIEAIQKIVNQAPKTLPLKNHGYIKHIAYDLADDADRATERSHIEAERKGTLRHDREATTAVPERLDPEWMHERYLKNTGKK